MGSGLKPGDKFPIGDHFLECMFHSDGERDVKQNSMTFIAIEEVAGLKLAKFEVALSFLCVSHGAPLAIKQSGQVWIHPKTNRCHKSTLYTVYTERVNRRYEHHLKTEMTITYSTADSSSKQ